MFFRQLHIKTAKKYTKKRDTYAEIKRIGLKNIRERLQYIYGSDYDFAIITREGAGTRVFLTVPIKGTGNLTVPHEDRL